MINVCIPTLNRYDKLNLLIESLLNGSIMPNIFVIDNGGYGNKFIDKRYFKYLKLIPVKSNIGVAASWNYFIKHIPEKRIICNDDILFTKYAIERFLSYKDKIVFTSIAETNAYSCFMFPDNLIKSVGYFDESLSPNYAYFEDNDFAYRMKLLDINCVVDKNIVVTHNESSTIEEYTKKELDLHHKKFKLARDNYVEKWGGLPTLEKHTSPYGRL